MFKKYIQKKLERYIVKYFKKHPEVKLVVVAGSIGKTSTKQAIATLLAQKYRVALQEGNHNTHLSAPLAILGIEYPGNIRSLGAWLSVFAAARRRIKEPSGTDVIIAELGSDRPGDMAQFARYLRPHIAVVTAVAPEHMEFFGTIDKVAEEELAAANMAELAIINRDDIDGRFAAYLTNANLTTYGTTGAAEYRFEQDDFTVEDGYKGRVIAAGYAEPILATIKVAGEHSLRPAMGGVAVAAKLGLTPTEIKNGLAQLRPVPGRMNILRGIEGSTIIDDTYNSSPVAAASALQTLYSLQAPQRIAILGDMNELGESSEAEHAALGRLCDPTLLAWVITVGEQSEKYLAPAARERGCQVKSFTNAIDAGAFAHSVMETGAVVLAKGSQGGIFLEEAVKVLCVMSEEPEIVRQSAAWLARKNAYFSKFKDKS